MKIVLNPVNLNILMQHHNIYNYKELALYAGLNYGSMLNCIEKGHLSIETTYLLADCLDCHMEDLIYVDWER